jgi:ATP-dependent DNA helicase UvrD/PcrA
MLLDSLNDRQKEAVLATDGPLLILAGAGSGKTRVIVHRVAHLIGSGAALPEEIYAVTFTNKAADEMKSRVADLLGTPRCGAWISTFHSLGLRILRSEGHRLGYRRGFVIYDDADQLALVRDLQEELGIDDRDFPARRLLGAISNARNLALDPDAYRAANPAPYGQIVGNVYALYGERLRAANAVDFDDLILRPLELFQREAEAAARWSRACRYLLVDEYQDTNHSQYRLIATLAAVHGNVCCVGDEDQSIYRFRGADIDNILRFERDFPGTRLIKLEQNYRSTKVILEAASAVVEHNAARIGKTLWTDNAEGEPIDLYCAADDLEEVAFVAEGIASLARPAGEAAVLYRTNAQSRLLEEALARRGIPYMIVGGVRFYDRKEIKDILAYLKLLVNPEDEVAWKRIVNVPPREIGKSTLDIVTDIATRERLTFPAAARSALERSLLTPRGQRALRSFQELLDRLRPALEEMDSGSFVAHLIDTIHYREYLERSGQDDVPSRLENLDELITAVGGAGGGEEGIHGFLERTALLSEVENTQGSGGVSLMTLHCAKGLEFPVVFMVGMEEHLFPHAHSRESESDVEEERRLCYVGMTRAKERLILTRAVSRRVFGRSQFNEPSRFLEELPPLLLRDVSRRSPSRPRRIVSEGGRSYVPDPGWDPESSPGRSQGAFGLGRRVHHPEYGIGTIIEVEGSGDSLKLTISFSVYGSKKFLPKYAPLEPI